LIAGKGHETYQEIDGTRHDFDDMKIVKDILDQLHKIVNYAILFISIFRPNTAGFWNRCFSVHYI
jgi:hypothetical protein